MTRTFRTHTRRRVSMTLWTIVFLLIGVTQVFSAQPPLVVILFLIIAAIGARIAWRRVTMPLYTLTDENLLISGVLVGHKRLRWQDIKDVKQESNRIRIIGREWIGGAEINLNFLSNHEQDEFLQLLQANIERAQAERESFLEGHERD